VLTIPFPNPPDEEQPPFNQGLQSVAAAIAQLLLAATALGYGGCWCTLPLEFAQKELEALLEVKPPWFLVAMLSIGVPTKVPRQPRRKNLLSDDFERFIAKFSAPGSLAEDKEEADFDMALARTAVETATERHVGKLEVLYGPTGEMLV
jgi:hypothetical protein